MEDSEKNEYEEMTTDEPKRKSDRKKKDRKKRREKNKKRRGEEIINNNEEIVKNKIEKEKELKKEINKKMNNKNDDNNKNKKKDQNEIKNDKNKIIDNNKNKIEEKHQIKNEIKTDKNEIIDNNKNKKEDENKIKLEIKNNKNEIIEKNKKEDENRNEIIDKNKKEDKNKNELIDKNKEENENKNEIIDKNKKEDENKVKLEVKNNKNEIIDNHKKEDENKIKLEIKNDKNEIIDKKEGENKIKLEIKNDKNEIIDKKEYDNKINLEIKNNKKEDSSKIKLKIINNRNELIDKKKKEDENKNEIIDNKKEEKKKIQDEIHNLNVINKANEKEKKVENINTSKTAEKDSKKLKYINPIIEYLKENDIEEFLGSNTKYGLVGLENLGNTCFMNSAIQCLSNCELLTKYFLSTKYKEDINCSSKYSTGGKIANSYYNLLEKLWKQSRPYVKPIEFYITFTHYVKIFNDSSQHDSHEMLIYLLEKLHEDLNRNVEKKYMELSEKQENETDIEASNRWWETHLKRDNSIITDLFSGQYKSTLRCPFCDKISITYDQFSCLELPLENKCFSGTSYVINEKDNKIRKINLIFGENEKFKEICEKINCQKTYKAILCRSSKMYLACLKDEHNLYELISFSHKRKEDFHDKIIFYEYEKNELDNKLLFFVVPIVFVQKSDEATGNNVEEEKFLFFPKIFYYSPKDKIQKFYQDLKKYYYKYYNEKDSDFPDEKIKLRIVNNLTACTKTHDPCDYCNSKECISCEFKFEKEMTMEELQSTQSKKRSFVMFLNIPIENFENNNFDSIKLYDNYLNDEEDFNLSNELTLENCFNSFSRCEKLDESNEWYCPKCKKHRRGYKQLEIFRLPIYLILELKRFRNQLGFFFDSKNSTFVEFPLEGLNLNKYLVGPKNHDYIYDLISVSHHYGLSFGGHYISVCKKDKMWFKFDDEEVTKIDKDRIVNSNAYILVYKLRD